MKLKYDPRAQKFLDKLNKKEKSKVLEYILLFEEYGFSLNQRYLKKIKGSIWELRPRRVRLFLYKGIKKQIIVHATYKKTQKITRKDLKIIDARIKQYL